MRYRLVFALHLYLCHGYQRRPVYDTLYCVRTSASVSTVTCSLDLRVDTTSSGISAVKPLMRVNSLMILPP
ncbi:hypothetical protein J3E71DRAFT_283421 [Bipolaris maydis]|nr:hypothetical protein J3E73DRAFT_300067 [Bipolaris maydis]KAJ6283597.1 hypothetical protein J3E71DRAFT_283421 [Bipolaris maydis]